MTDEDREHDRHICEWRRDHQEMEKRICELEIQNSGLRQKVDQGPCGGCDKVNEAYVKAENRAKELEIDLEGQRGAYIMCAKDNGQIKAKFAEVEKREARFSIALEDISGISCLDDEIPTIDAAFTKAQNIADNALNG